ncbi:MAG: PepSY domain-containing protein [Gammaproteobacteria bacterium]|nr:PepSY domain-containing protein [Gammaproteobacteria bacterium]
MDRTTKGRLVPAAAMAIATILGAGLVGTAMATDDDAARESRDRSQPSTVAAASGAALDGAGIIARLQARGYHDFREVERDDDGRYEVKARDASGRRVELYVDSTSGDILRTERDD